ncbi:MAG: TetR/AcrR family transcriptional regulator, partial [Propionibacteriales bacterium]|nr:TetR/AcrR family transcriptional regulator [Propionibacteriales bacterium]
PCTWTDRVRRLMVGGGGTMITLDDLAPDEVTRSTAVGERLLATAEELFYREGIGRIGVDRLADEAGVTKRTLYQRFGSKDGLITAYLERRRHRWQSHLLDRLMAESPATAVDAIAVVFAVAEQWAEQNTRGCAFVNAWVELSPTAPPALAVIRAEKSWMQQVFGRVVGDDDLGVRIHLLYEGAQVLRTTMEKVDAFEQAGRMAQDLVRVNAG